MNSKMMICGLYPPPSMVRRNFYFIRLCFEVRLWKILRERGHLNSWYCHFLVTTWQCTTSFEMRKWRWGKIGMVDYSCSVSYGVTTQLFFSCSK